MKTIQISTYGHSDQIQINETERPSLGKGEILVRIHAAGVNPVDWKIREGFMADQPLSQPITLGQDFAGEVVEVAPGTKDFKPGDEVFGFADGAYAEFASVAPTTVARKPRSIDFVTAAALPTPGCTAYQLVMNEIRPFDGQTVLVHGAAGAVGSIATQLLVHGGAKVIVNASSRDFVYLRELGASTFIDYQSERFENQVRDVDAVVDLVGGDTLARSIDVVKRGGIVLTTVGGLDQERANRAGIRNVQFMMSQNSRDLSELAKLVDENIVKVRVKQVLPLYRAKKAQDLNQTGHSHGKIILKVA